VFLCVTFRGSPFLRSAMHNTKDADSTDSARPTTAYASPLSPTPSPSPPSSLTDVHRCIGYRNPHCQSLTNTVRLTYLCVYDNRDGVCETAPSPSPPSSLPHVHRCIGYHNPHWQSLSNSERLTYLSVYDSRDRDSETALFSPPPPHSRMYTVYKPPPSPHPPSSRSHVLRSFGFFRV
jgi:hypothetical protein